MGKRNRQTAGTAPETSAPPPTETPPPTTTRTRRTRTGLKRTTFQVPKKMPAPVRALWKSASAEERERAHQTAVTVLKTWLGKVSREEGARELGLTPLRFWQLSQQAVAGLVAGCLKQPRFRGRAVLEESEPQRAELKRRILMLEREVEAGRRLIALLRELPGHKEAEGRAGTEARRGKAKRKRRQADGAAAQGRGTDAVGSLPA